MGICSGAGDRYSGKESNIRPVREAASWAPGQRLWNSILTPPWPRDLKTYSVCGPLSSPEE